MTKPLTRLAAFAGIAIATTSALPVAAVVLHPADSVASTPTDAVMARWGGSASGVVISSQHILTTRHQGGGFGATVWIDGNDYLVDDVTVIEDPETPSNELDLRVARLVDKDTLVAANFTETVGIYTGTDEIGKTLVIGGYGEGRGSAIAGGYLWDGIDGTLRWGANEITGTEDDVEFDAGIIYNNDIIKATFEGPSDINAVDGEASLARDDSGGGWFIFDGSDWQLVALSQGVENTDEALFDETLSAVRLSSYATQINNAVPEPSSAALLFTAMASCLMRRRRSA